MKNLKFTPNLIIGLFLLLLLTACSDSGSTPATSGIKNEPSTTQNTIAVNLAKVTISGNVIDNDSQQPLINAKISVEGNNAEGNTDQNGNFSLNVETSNSVLLVNTSASGFSTSQKIIELNNSNVSQLPFTNIALKSSKLLDSYLLSSIASTGKRNKESIKIPLTKVQINVNTENGVIPGNSSTNEAETYLDFLAAEEIALIDLKSNKVLVNIPSNFSYNLTLSFKIEESNLDLAGLPLWFYDKTLGKWVLLSKAELISSAVNGDDAATVVYKIYKTGWFALGKRIKGLACIKGRVIDQGGNPLVGIYVYIEGISFNGLSYGATNHKGIFEFKTKPGATINVTALYSNIKAETQTVTLQNYTHNYGGAANNSFCQPAGPSDKSDSFYTKFPDFLNLAPPVGFDSALTSDNTPITFMIQVHKIIGSLTYLTPEGSKPLPKQSIGLKPTNLQVSSYGAFPLTAEGLIEFLLPLTKSTTLNSIIVYNENDLVYFGKSEIHTDINHASTFFSMELANTTITTITGVVTFGGTPAANATVNLSIGISTSTNESGAFKIEVPSLQLTNGTSLSAVYNQLDTGAIYFSNSVNTTSDIIQIFKLEIMPYRSEISGLVVDKLNNPIQDAKVIFLIDEKSFGINTTTNASGEYSIMVPSKSSGVLNIKIIASAEQPDGSKIATSFCYIQISNDDLAPNEISKYSAKTISLDLSSKNTKVKGRIQVNGIFKPGVSVIFKNIKTETKDGGEFEAIVQPGKNILSIFVGNEPAQFENTLDNNFAFSAIQGLETDLGILKVTTKKPFVYFEKNQFQLTQAVDALPIKTAIAAPNSFVFFQIKAKGTKESPKIILHNDTAINLSEVIDTANLTTTAIYKIEIGNPGILSLNFEASEANSDITAGSNTLLILSENQAPIILEIKSEKVNIEATNSSGITFAVEAMDPEGSELKYKWNIESPKDGTAELKNTDKKEVRLTSKKITSSEVIISITVSDGELTTSKNIIVKVIESLPKLIAFDLSPLNIVSVQMNLTVQLITDDPDSLSSLKILWGDASAAENLALSKNVSVSHVYATEGTYSIEVILIDKNNKKASYRNTIIVSDTYHAPILNQGTLNTTEDTSAKLDLNSLITNFDKKKNYTFSITKSPSLGTAVIEGNNLTYSPNKDQNGLDLAILTVFDGVSSSNESDLRISVKAVNDVPKLSNTSYDATLGVTLQIDLKNIILDPDTNDVHTFKIAIEPRFGTTSINGSMLSYLPSVAGLETIAITVSDNTSESNRTEISITNNALLANISINGGAFETFQNKDLTTNLIPFLVNPNNVQPINFIISQQGKLGTSYISENKLVYVPNKNAAGDDKITIIAKTDQGQATEPALFSIKIIPVMQAPILKSGNYAVKEGNTLAIDLTKLVENFDATQTYSFEIQNSAIKVKGNAVINANILQYTPKKGEEGVETISVFAISNNLTSNNAILLISIEKIIQLPVITSLPITTVNEGSVYFYKIEASHPDNFPLTIELKNGPNWLKLDANVLSGNPKQNDVGFHQVSLIVQDGTNTVEQNFSVEVINFNFAPNFISVPPTTGTSSLLYSYHLEAIDPDGDDLTFSIIEGPIEMQINKKNNSIEWIPLSKKKNSKDDDDDDDDDNEENKNYSVKVQVTDGKLSKFQNWTIELTISAPVIVSIIADDPDDGDKIFSAGDTITINFDQATNTPDVKNTGKIKELLNFNEPIGSKFTGIWQSNCQLIITITDPGNANPGIGTLRIGINLEGNLLNENETSNPSISTSDILKGNWGKK